MEEENFGFKTLDNKAIGQNIYTYRKIRQAKASEVAEYLGIKEASYTRYERGEAAITIEIIQKISEFLKVDPIMLLSVTPGTLINSGNNSPNACISNHGYFNNQPVNDHQNQMMLKLMENVLSISDKLIDLLNKKND